MATVSGFFNTKSGSVLSQKGPFDQILFAGSIYFSHTLGFQRDAFFCSGNHRSGEPDCMAGGDSRLLRTSDHNG